MKTRKTTTVKPADRYQQCDDMWVITTYFNLSHDSNRTENYRIFAESLRNSGIHLVTVECAFSHDPFTLTSGEDILQVRCRDILWQKERLLNLAIHHLPGTISKVAWIDGDILFSNPSWAVQTSALLDKYPVVQLWEYAIRLQPGDYTPTGNERTFRSMAKVMSTCRGKYSKGEMDPHGQTGFAWAARRDLLTRCGLYDTGFDVGADHLIAHSYWGEFDHPCVQAAMGLGIMQNSLLRRSSSPVLIALRRLMPEVIKNQAPWRRWRRENTYFRKHFLSWAQDVYAVVQGQVGYTPGTILHLWHNDKTRLAPWQVREGLHTHNFDPQSDLRIGVNGCWEWAQSESPLRNWVNSHTPLNYQTTE
jgi:hypothetical protein